MQDYTSETGRYNPTRTSDRVRVFAGLEKAIRDRRLAFWNGVACGALGTGVVAVLGWLIGTNIHPH